MSANKTLAYAYSIIYNDMPNLGFNSRGDLASFKCIIREETLQKMVYRLSKYFSRKYPRFGDEYVVQEHIKKSISTDLLELGKKIINNGPNHREIQDGYRNGMILKVKAIEGAGCINWKSALFHNFFHPEKEDVIRKQTYGVWND